MSNNIKPYQLCLYAITDRHWLGGRELSHVVEEALKGGVTMLQFREKNLPREELIAEARKVREVAARYHVPFIVNDHVSVAKEIDADGVHIGQSDTELKTAREILGPDKIIGVTAPSVSLAVAAEQMGADYIGAGAVFPTDSKQDTKPLSLENLKKITDAVSIPVVAIGGIGADNLTQLEGTGICGIAVISAIFAADDIQKSTGTLKKLTTGMLGK
jgi:thiamine-phosphate pyrophosphorylase